MKGFVFKTDVMKSKKSNDGNEKLKFKDFTQSHKSK